MTNVFGKNDNDLIMISMQLHGRLTGVCFKGLFILKVFSLEILSVTSYMKLDTLNLKNLGSFSFPPPTSHELQLISVTSGFTRLSMKTKYTPKPNKKTKTLNSFEKPFKHSCFALDCTYECQSHLLDEKVDASSRRDSE